MPPQCVWTRVAGPIEARADIVPLAAGFSVVYVQEGAIKAFDLDLEGVASDPVVLVTPGVLKPSTPRVVALDQGMGVVWADTIDNPKSAFLQYLLLDDDGSVGPSITLDMVLVGILALELLTDGGIAVVPAGGREFIVTVVDLAEQRVKAARFNDTGRAMCP
jgi:hypothetical protein